MSIVALRCFLLVPCFVVGVGSPVSACSLRGNESSQARTFKYSWFNSDNIESKSFDSRLFVFAGTASVFAKPLCDNVERGGCALRTF